MDIRINSSGFCLLLCTIAIFISVSYGRECRLCKPGYYASRQCTKSHDTVCKPCSKGTFTSVTNWMPTCSLCSRCDLGEFALKPCTKNSDTVCKLCSEVKDINSVQGSYVKECLHIQNDQAPIDTDLTKSDVTTQAPDDIVWQSSGSDPDEITVAVIYGEVEGSGETPPPEETEKNETETELVDGLVPIVVEVPVENVTLDIPPEVTKHKPDDKDTTTTLRTIIIGVGSGIEINPTDPPEDVVDVVDVNLNEPPARTGASKSADRQSGGTSIGVVVTVGLVAALVFFILGFVASRLWNSRRERTFNVMEAERFNGKHPVECSGIEYKDNDKPANKASIYDEIPAATKVNGSTNDTRDPEKASDPVYSKPIKRDTAQKTSTAPPVTPKRGDPSPRPASEIRFIDEDQQDEETDRLLSSGTGSDVTNDSNASSSASGNSDKIDNEAADDEKTPMLSKGTDKPSS